MKHLAIFPGSFDPLTVGHLDIIQRAAGLFDEVMVAVLHNPAKKGTIPFDERLLLIRKACSGLPNVQAAAWDGMLADLVKTTGACAVVRGIRDMRDFDTENAMACLNRDLLPGLETVFLPTLPQYGHISSSAVREIASFGKDVSAYLPESILNDVLPYLK